jgi:hypothetical protein
VCDCVCSFVCVQCVYGINRVEIDRVILNLQVVDILQLLDYFPLRKSSVVHKSIYELLYNYAL